MKQIVRQLDILRELQARRYGVSVRELAEEYNVERRTIQRDLGDLREAGFILNEKTACRSAHLLPTTKGHQAATELSDHGSRGDDLCRASGHGAWWGRRSASTCGRRFAG